MILMRLIRGLKNTPQFEIIKESDDEKGFVHYAYGLLYDLYVRAGECH